MRLAPWWRGLDCPSRYWPRAYNGEPASNSRLILNGLFATMANRPRLQWKRSADMPTWLTATWEGAGPHDGANIHKVSGVASGEAWRWQVGRNMRTVAGFASTKQEASDRANEAWWEMMGMKD